MRRHRINLQLAHRPGAVFVSPECAQPAPLRDHVTARRWRHLDHGNYPTWLHAHVPRVTCPEHGIRRVRVPGHCPAPASPSPSSGMPSMCSGRPTSRGRRACPTSVGTRPGTSWDGRSRAGCGPNGAASSPASASTRKRWPGDIAISSWSATWTGPPWSTSPTTGGRPASTPTSCPSPRGSWRASRQWPWKGVAA